MTTLTGPRYGYGGYEEDEDDLDPDQLHPQVKRQARRIVQRERMSRLRHWWISLVGAMASAACIAAVILAVLGLVLSAWVAALVATALTLYLVSLALRPASAA